MELHSLNVTFRVFRGNETKQVDINGWKAIPEFWYVEPYDYTGDILWSPPFESKENILEYVQNYLDGKLNNE